MAVTMTNERMETLWKWVLRCLGLLGFFYLIINRPDAPVAFYVLLAGLLGLPNIIGYQIAVNRSNAKEKRDVDENDAG